MADLLLPADPMIGMIIGSFVIIQLLGRGGMGAVYLAQHKAAPHIRCVFKTILAHLSHNPLMISRFNTETEAVGRLADHENIVELKDFGVLPNGQMYMQFEFIDGTPLDRFLVEWGGRLSLHRAIYLAFQVCNALDHAHATGIVHRDLKPDNLLVVVQDKNRVPRLVKLVDFGISKVVRIGEVQTISGMVMGTPYYMSVEQYANAAEATAKSDVYSLAILLWLMITGELPWGRPDPNVLYHLQRTVVPTPPPEYIMPAAVARILLRCFSIDPDDRPTMQELAVELAAVVAATDDAPSGGAILMHIAPHFLTSSPDHARTVPHAAVASPDGVAAQLWPPIKTAATPASQHDGRLPPLNVDTRSGQAAPPEPVAAAGGLPSAPVHVPQARPSAPAADGRALVAPAPPAPTALLLPAAAVSAAAAPPAAWSRPSSSRASALAGAAAGGRGLPAPVIAAFPTGLISQKHIAQDPPIDVLSAAPRVRSVVAASEIVRAAGTPGPRPYAHAELPAVVVSNTQLSGVTSEPRAPAARPAGQSEPPPFLVLPGVVRSASHRKLLVVVAALCATLVAIASFALVRRASPIVGSSADQGGASSRSPGSVAGGFIATTDAGAAVAEAHAAVAVAPSLAADAGEPMSGIDAGATSLVESNAQRPDLATARALSATSPAQSSPGASQQAASDAAVRTPDGLISSRSLPGTPPKSVDQGPSPVRTPTARASSEPTSTEEVTLIIRVRGFATVSIDGDDPSASPRRKRVPVGVHHVVMSGYPDGADEKKTKEFDVNVPAGRPEIVIHKTW